MCTKYVIIKPQVLNGKSNANKKKVGKTNLSVSDLEIFEKQFKSGAIDCGSKSVWDFIILYYKLSL